MVRGGDVKFLYNLDMLLILHHAGMGGDVNISCNLPTLLMLHYTGVGGN